MGEDVKSGRLILFAFGRNKCTKYFGFSSHSASPTSQPSWTNLEVPLFAHQDMPSSFIFHAGTVCSINLAKSNLIATMAQIDLAVLGPAYPAPIEVQFNNWWPTFLTEIDHIALMLLRSTTNYLIKIPINNAPCDPSPLHIFSHYHWSKTT